MEELKRELEKLSKTYVDTPEKEEKIFFAIITGHAFWVPYSSYVATNEKWTWDTT